MFDNNAQHHKESHDDEAKRAGREVETETKKGMRELDGHDLGDDIANAGDEVKKTSATLATTCAARVAKQGRASIASFTTRTTLRARERAHERPSSR